MRRKQIRNSHAVNWCIENIPQQDEAGLWLIENFVRMITPLRLLDWRLGWSVTDNDSERTNTSGRP
jgi:hypothetical protein